jgi:hypothetical protein
LCDCYCSQLIRISVFKHFVASFSESKPVSQLSNRHGPLLTVRLMFLSFFKGALLPNLNKMVECEILILVVQHLEDIFNIICLDLHVWLNILSVGAKGVSADWHKLTQCKLGDYCNRKSVYPFKRRAGNFITEKELDIIFSLTLLGITKEELPS